LYYFFSVEKFEKPKNPAKEPKISINTKTMTTVAFSI